MILMVGFAIGDFSCFCLLSSFLTIILVFCTFGKKRWSFGMVGTYQILRLMLMEGWAWDLFKERHAGHVYIWFFLVIVSTIENVISLLVSISCLSTLPSFLHFPYICRLVDLR
jgi:hypothetical protein